MAMAVNMTFNLSNQINHRFEDRLIILKGLKLDIMKILLLSLLIVFKFGIPHYPFKE